MAKHESIKQPAAIVIFGGTGDLTKRKLIPAFYNLFLSKHLPDNFTILLLAVGTKIKMNNLNMTCSMASTSFQEQGNQMM